MSTTLQVDVVAQLKDEITGKIASVRSSLDTLKRSTDELAASSKTAGTGGTAGAAGINQMGTASTTASSKMKTFASSAGALLTAFSTVAISVTNLALSYRDLTDRQIGVNTATIKLESFTMQLAKAHQATTDALAKYGPQSQQYQDALAKEQLLEAKVENQKLKLGEAQEALGDAYTRFGLSILPTVLSVAGTVGTAYSKLSTNATAAATATEGLSKASKLMTVLKIAAPLAVIAAAYMAIRTNAFGCRDALDAVGKSIGDQIPALKPLLTWLKDLGTALGLTGEKLDLSKAWKTFTDGVTTAFNAVKNFDWAQAVQDIATSIETTITNWNWDTAWKSFKDALFSTGTWITEKTGAIQTAIETALGGFDWATSWKAFQDALYGTGAWLTKMMGLIGTGIALSITKEGPKWWAGFQEALGATATWLTTQMTLLGTAIAKEITAKGAEWWKGFQDALGSSVKWVGEQMKKVGQAILDYAWDTLGGNIWGKIGKGISDAASGVGKWATDVGTGLQKALNIIPSETPPSVIQNVELSDYAIPMAELQEYKDFVASSTTEISAYFVTMKTSITSTMTQLGTILTTFSSTTLATIASTVSTQTTLVSAHFLTMKTSVTATITALQTLLGAFASTTLSTIATAVSTQTTVMSAAFLTMKTSVSTQIIALQTLLGAFASTTLSTVASAVTQQTTNMSASFLAMKTSITGSITQTQTALTTFSTTVSTQTAAMTTKINSFSSAMVSAMDKITKSMDTAKKSADALKKSIDALKDKTITITTRYVTSGNPAGQHGYSGIVGAPGNVGGVKVGEGFRPELITVTPLTRGTGNHYGATMGGGFGSPGGAGGGEVINNITVVLDGRVIQRFVEKTALAGIGAQI